MLPLGRDPAGSSGDERNRTPVVVDQPPFAVLQHEHVGRDDGRARDKLAAVHDGCTAQQRDVDIAGHEAPGAESGYIGRFMGRYCAAVTAVGFLVQLLLVSRIIQFAVILLCNVNSKPS